MHTLCLHITNDAAYIDYGKEPPPAATTAIHPKTHLTSLKKGHIHRDNFDKIGCMHNTCANKGICYESYEEDDIINPAYLREEYENEKDSKWMVAAFVPICDCDLTSYTGSTCEEGNDKMYPLSKPRDINVN